MMWVNIDTGSSGYMIIHLTDLMPLHQVEVGLQARRLYPNYDHIRLRDLEKVGWVLSLGYRYRKH